MKLPKHIPAPRPGRNLYEWAVTLVNALNSANANQSDRSVVMLAHKSEGDRMSASEDGIMMYDPVAKAVIVSIDGEWRQLTVTGV